jgi:hypothetical protein
MPNKYSKTLSVSRLHAGAKKAHQEAILAVIEDHKRTGRPVVIWRDGKVVKVPASQLLRKRAALKNKNKRGR